MSRLSKKPISVSRNINSTFKNGIFEVNGPNGKLSLVINSKITIKICDFNIFVEALEESRKSNVLRGLTRGLIVNMIKGVEHSFKKELEVVGLGYKVNIENNENGFKKLVLSVGFSHLVNLCIPYDIKVNTNIMANKNTIITVVGIDKYKVGAFAAQIRLVKPPEPYKGFGIRYLTENILRKAGKAAASMKK
ncbi:MAG: 50S ribosomal protein L6 [Endomicrobium sp.]|jgi:large subunit ribosomal protein L6|nr:50S ribosomal protein L6 [Endomicrobium sp.]